MTLCKVTGTLVATQKNEHLKGKSLLIVQPVDLGGKAFGKDFVALDSVNAGVGDTVLVIQEGQGAAQVFHDKQIPIHSVIVAVVDGLDLQS